jgi:hypothetical protein
MLHRSRWDAITEISSFHSSKSCKNTYNQQVSIAQRLWTSFRWFGIEANHHIIHPSLETIGPNYSYLYNESIARSITLMISKILLEKHNAIPAECFRMFSSSTDFLTRLSHTYAEKTLTRFSLQESPRILWYQASSLVYKQPAASISAEPLSTDSAMFSKLLHKGVSISADSPHGLHIYLLIPILVSITKTPELRKASRKTKQNRSTENSFLVTYLPSGRRRSGGRRVPRQGQAGRGRLHEDRSQRTLHY